MVSRMYNIGEEVKRMKKRRIRFSIRIEEELHRWLKEKKEEEGKSMNIKIGEIIKEYKEREGNKG